MDYYQMNDPFYEEGLFEDELGYDTGYDEGYDFSPDTNDVKEVVGQAISGIPGVLALKGKLTDIFKQDEDLTRGISVKKQDDYRVQVSVKVIAEAGYNEADLIQQMTEAITDALQEQMSLVADKVDVEIAERLSLQEFYSKYDADRALH